MPAIVAFDAKYRTELVTEPLTLVPHWYRSEKLTNVTFNTAKGEVQVRETEELTDQFRYETVDGGGSR